MKDFCLVFFLYICKDIMEETLFEHCVLRTLQEMRVGSFWGEQ